VRRTTVRIGIVTVGAIATLLLGAIGWSATVERSVSPILIIAHHGDVANWPENTLEGILAARDLGADGVEIDLQRSRDGTWWLVHDALDRSTTGRGAVSDKSDLELASLTVDGGLGYRPETRRDLKVPSFEDVLLALRGWNGILVVDVKSRDPTSHLEVASLLRSAGRGDAWMLASSVAAVGLVEEQVPTIYTVLDFEYATAIDRGDADGWSFDADLPLMPVFTRLLRGSLNSVAIVHAKYRSDESTLFLKANAANVTMFITNHLRDSLALRDGL
jgi:glycerophosphoryl diester phosphodiesterase